MDKKQAKKVILRRLVGIIVLLLACVVGGTYMSAPRRSEASSAEARQMDEVKTEAVKAKTAAEDGDTSSQFMLYFMIALIIFVAVSYTHLRAHET